MTYSHHKGNYLTEDEWREMAALKNAINDNPATVHPDKMELFTELFVRSLEGKCDPPLDNAC
jgi:hypothetical protein